MRKLLAKVDHGRFSRAVAGLQADWQWDAVERGEGQVHRFVRHVDKEYRVAIVDWKGRCSCADAIARGVLCKHVAFAALSDLGLAAAARSAHRQLV